VLLLLLQLLALPFFRLDDGVCRQLSGAGAAQEQLSRQLVGGMLAPAVGSAAAALWLDH
jgi:hypothetical protein